jgi:hypothetical protein
VCEENKNKIVQSLALPALLFSSENWTINARDARRIIAAEMKYVRRTAGYSWTYDKISTDCKGIKYNSSFGQNTGLQEKLDTTCK